MTRRRPAWTSRAVACRALTRWPQRGRAAPTAIDRLISFGENTTWRVVDACGRPAAALRIYRPGRWTNEQILVEHDLMRLIGPDLGVAPPLPGHDGESLQFVPDSTLRASLVRWIPGRIFTGRADGRRLRRLGRYIGLLHGHLTGTAPTGAARRWDETSLVTDPLRHARHRWSLEISDRPFPPVLDQYGADCLDRWRRLCPAATLLHADLHMGNLKWSRHTSAASTDGIHCVDFDDCGVAPLPYDLAVPALDCRGAEDPNVVVALLAGYAETAPLPIAAADVRLFMAIRVLWGMGWVSERPEIFAPGRLARSLTFQADLVAKLVDAM